MKLLLVAEYRDGLLLGNYLELIAFSQQLDSGSVMVLVGSESDLPQYDGTVYLADVASHGEYNPVTHKKLILDVVAKEKPDGIIFCHSSYGWDLAPRVAYALGASQVSEVVAIQDGMPVIPVCNSKLRRTVKSKTPITVYTLQAGAFSLNTEVQAEPLVEKINAESSTQVVLSGYEAGEEGGVDLTKSEVIVSGGRGIGKPENVTVIQSLAEALGGEYGASRPVVDAEWVEHNRQVGTTGQTVSPKLYFACGISGAIQHLAGMKKSEFIVAVNTDKDAPIGEVANVLVVADLKEFIPVLTDKIQEM